MKQTIIQLNGKTYTINPFRGIEGWSFLPKITKFVLPVINLATGFGASSSEDGKLDLESLKIQEESATRIIMELLSGSNGEEVVVLIQDLLRSVIVDGSVINFDKEFEQNYDTMLKLVYEVVKLNYLESFQRLVSQQK